MAAAILVGCNLLVPLGILIEVMLSTPRRQFPGGAVVLGMVLGTCTSTVAMFAVVKLPTTSIHVPTPVLVSLVPVAFFGAGYCLAMTAVSWRHARRDEASSWGA